MRKPSLNHVYRLVWNSTIGSWVATSEVGAARGKRSSGRRLRATLLASLIAPAGAAFAQTIIDGNGGGGCMVLSGSCDTTVSINLPTSNATYTNFFTQGGAGSGGGAGLGGVFFVDTGNTLNLNNVNFIGNVAKGGEGGSPLPVDVSAVSVGLVARTANVGSVSSLQATPTVTYNAGSGTYSVSSFSLANPSTLIGVGETATVSAGVAGSNITTVSAVTGNTVSLASPITIAASNVASLGSSTLTLGSSTVTSTAFSGLSNSAVGVGTAVFGTGIPAGTVVTAVNRDNSNNITSLTLSNNATANVAGTGTLNLVNVTSFDTAQFSRNVAGGVAATNSITMQAAAFGLSVGMTITGDGVPANTKVTAINGNTVTLSNALPVGVNSFTGSLPIGTVGGNTIQLASPDSRFVVGSVISGTGIPDGTTITAYNATTGVVTLSQNLTSVPSVIATSTILGQSGQNLTLRSVAGLSVGMTVSGNNINDGTTITSISGNTVHLSAAPSGTVNGFTASSLLSVGGSLNGIRTTGSSGPNGGNGTNASTVIPYITDGEGLPGTNGGNANNNGRTPAVAAPGASGGRGGNGSGGVPFNYNLLLETITAANDMAEAITEAAGALATFPPGVAESAALIAASVEKGIALGLAINNVIEWGQGLANGTRGMGGAGGAGGNGGNGATFYGGGAGGAGGAGGNGALSFTQGGDGGAGGSGGNGGFGAGGGSGGAAGAGGTTGYSQDGSAGSGGAGGFGGGQGSAGDGTGGAGGSGYGGAIFVRAGGTLTITGNALFRDNVVLAGSSTNGGSAGDAAGTDLFIMKGANVTLAPGAGNTIRFEGSIADDSASSIGSASWSAGYGAAITIAGGGLVQFAGTNTYSGRTIIQGATLEATIGEGINSASTIFFNGSGTIGTLVPHVNAGVLLLSQDVTVRAGSLIPGQIMWNGAGGFAAGTADGITLSFGKTVGGSAQTLVWGSSYLASGSTLVFGSEYGQGRVTLTNNINLNGQVGQVVVYRNPGDVAGGANTAYLTGVMSNGGLIVGSAGYDGYLYITGQNALSSYTQNSGTVMTMAGNFGQAGVAPGRLMAPTGGAVTLNGGVLMLYAPEMMTTLTVNSGSGAQLYALAQVTATNVSNSGVISLLGGGQLTSLTNNAGATFATTGSLGVAGAISNAATATIYQGNIPVLYDQGVAAANAPVISASVVNNGTWVVYGGQSISTVTLSGNGTFTLVDAGGGLTLVQSGNSTWAGTMTGAGGFAKDGAGYLTLTGASTNTGGTAVLAGTLDTTGGGTLSDTGPVAVSAGAYLILGTLDTIGALTNAGTVTVNAAQTTGTIVNTGTITNNATLNSGAIANNAGGTFNMNANVTSGAVTNAAGATINLAANLNTGTNTLTNQGQINITGTPSITTGGLAGTTTAANINVASGAGLTLMQSGNTTYAGSITGAGSMRYSGPGTLTVLRNAGAPVSRINLTGGPLIVNSGTLALGTTSTNGANILAPTTALVVNGGSVVMVGVETITTANVASGASLASVDPLTATGAVTNAGTISLYSGGTLASLANNAGGTFTTAGAGLTVTGALVNAATATLYQGNNPTLVAASSPNTVSAITAGSITNNGAWSVYGTQTATTPTLTGTGNIALLTTGGGLTLVQSGTSTYAGTMSGAGSFSKSGAGVLTLTGASSNTGGTNVLAGTLSTAGGGTFAATDPISVSNGATLLLATAGTFGTLTNAGTVTMSAAQTTGAITNSGTITNTATLTSGTIANNANGTFNMNANVTSGAVTNAANATINLAANLNTGAGTLTNNGTINVSGNRTVTTAGLAGTANGGSVAIAAAGTLNLNQSGNTSYAGSITGAGSLVLNGAGTLTLTQNAGMGVGQVNLGGTITVNNGTLALNGNGILASNSQVVVNSGATTGTLQLVSGNQVISSLAGAGVINLGANQLTVANGGSFTGTVLGSGTVNVQNGAFSVNSSVSSTDPNSVFTVGGGAASTTTVAPGATLSFPTVSLTSNSTLVVSGGVTSNNVTMAPGSTMQVNAGSTVTSSGSTTLTGSSTLNNSGTLTSPTVNLTGSGGNAPTLHLGNGLAPTAPGAVLGNVVANTTNVNGGTLTGNGSVSVSGTTTITGQSNILQGTLAPGNSPGVMNFGNLILGNLSTSVMQVSGAVAGARVAGTDYDRVNITGTFQILPGAVMTIQKYDPTVEMARGETLKLFNFAAGQITGQFTSVTSTFTNDVIYSLGTGSVIGMGPAGYAGFLQRVGNTGNQRDILSQLMVNQTGGVKQFYGGALLDRVAAADALGQDTSVVFARFSPEAYIGLLENVKDALFNGGPGIMDDVSRETLGGSVSLSRRTRNSNSGGDYERLNMNGNGLRLGYSASHGQGIWKATVQLEEGNTNSSWLSNKTNGVQATLAGTYDLEGTQGVRLLGRLGLAHMDNNVTRTTNLGAARVPSVGADAMLGGIGLGHLTTVDGIKYRSSIELLSYSASVNGFVESNVSSATDALSVNRQSRSGMATVVDLGGSTRVVERVDIDLGLRYMNFGSKTNTVTANVVTETVPVTVRNPGLGNSQVSVNGGVSYALDKGESVVFGVSSFLNKGTYLNLTYNRAF